MRAENRMGSGLAMPHAGPCGPSSCWNADLTPGVYIRHPSSFEHDTGGHPENARRLTAIEEAMSERDWLGMEMVEAPAVERELLHRVHGASHVDSIEELSGR